MPNPNRKMSTDHGEQSRLEHLKEMSAFAAEDARMVHLRVTAALALAVLYLTQLPFTNLIALNTFFKWCLIAGLAFLVGAALLYFEYASAAHRARFKIATTILDGTTTDYANWWNTQNEGVWKSKSSAFHWGNALFGLGTAALGLVLTALLGLI